MARTIRVAARVVARIVRAWLLAVSALPRFTLTTAVVAGLTVAVRRPLVGYVVVAVWLVVTGLLAVWSVLASSSFDRVVAGPWRRHTWRRWARTSWPMLAAVCGLADRRDPPRTATLHRVTARGNVVTLVVRPVPGQCVEDVEAAVPALAVAAGAVSTATWLVEAVAVEVSMVMRSVLDVHPATLPTAVVTDTVTVGRRVDGSPWMISVRGRHTLVVGCSGSGKGSILWGLVGGLAPAIAAGLVRVWGVDLKRGVELAMGRALFHTLADNPTDALQVLTELLQVITVRGRVMAGTSRLHTPTPGDPLHVLVVDELATLVAYADPDTRRDASRLLAEILSQGRALGVVVVACVQDPRKDTIGFRGLFTQTVALRLRGPEETRMVLGDGLTSRAPAQRISPAVPGTGYVIGDDGTIDLVRANWWPDTLVQATAATYPAPLGAFTLPAPALALEDDDHDDDTDAASVAAARGGRKPRTPRTPRGPRAERVEPASVVVVEESGGVSWPT